MGNNNRVPPTGGMGTPIFIDATSISTLGIKNGDVVVVRVPKQVNAAAAVQALANQMSNVLHHLGLDQSIIIAIQEGVSLDTLDEDQMREVGWVRDVSKGMGDNEG